MNALRPSKKFLVPLALLSLLAVGGLAACEATQRQGNDQVASVNERKTRIPVEGMSCASCAARIKGTLTKMDGVTHAEVRLAERDAVIRYVDGKLTPQQIADAITALGYKAGTPQQD